MTKFLVIGRKCINLAHVNYIDLGEEGSDKVTVYFGGPGDPKESIQFTGDEAIELWERLEEENILGTSAPRQ